jgi:ATP-dependent Clp protease protease subunit
MSLEINAVQAPYGGGGGAYYRTPPPDLPSLLLERAHHLLGATPGFADEYKRQLGVDVTKLIIAQLAVSAVRRS